MFKEILNKSNGCRDVQYDVSRVIIYMKKLLDSDWLRAVQFKCNTSAKSVTPVQQRRLLSDWLIYYPGTQALTKRAQSKSSKQRWRRKE